MGTEPTYTALRAYNRRLAGMLADPECVGELLLVGIGMARALDLGDPPRTEAGSLPMNAIVEQVYGRNSLPSSLLYPGRPTDRVDPNPYRRVRDVFHADRRRYRPEDTDRWYAVTCGRPMVRREGLCARSASHTQRVVDPATGQRQWVGACSNRPCRDWLAGLVDRNVAELAVSPSPDPPANTGGVLERHLPEIDWWALWGQLDPRWKPPPEGEMFRRPTLTLVIADDSAEDDVPVVTTRPTLVVHEGGWR